MNPQKMRDTLVELYLDWVNNYLTRGKMASDYGLSPVMLAYMIEQGQMIHEERVASYGQSLVGNQGCGAKP